MSKSRQVDHCVWIRFLHLRLLEGFSRHEFERDETVFSYQSVYEVVQSLKTQTNLLKLSTKCNYWVRDYFPHFLRNTTQLRCCIKGINNDWAEVHEWGTGGFDLIRYVDQSLRNFVNYDSWALFVGNNTDQGWYQTFVKWHNYLSCLWT